MLSTKTHCLLQIRGRTDVCVEVCSDYRVCRGEMIIDANVTDPTSNTTVQCGGQTSVPVNLSPYKLEILEEDGGFYPCYFTTVKVHWCVPNTTVY